MARLAYNLNFQRPSQLPLDSKRRILDDDDDSILDDSILDRTTPEMSVDGQIIRRESFADTSSNFSPRESGWSEFSYGGDPASVHKMPNASSHFFMERDGSAFMRAEVAHGAAYGNPSSTWHLQNAAPGSGTPTTVCEGFPSDYEIKPAQPAYGNDALPVDHPNVYAGLPVRSGPIFPPSTALSASPQSGQDWISNSSSEQMERQAMPKHGPIDSPTYHPNPPLLRRDGIRKKNARFEIPAERTLRTIDHLINQTNDEQEIKELKQQKRLLRNRQAALDSRQRKKQHTERLEEEKKHTSTVISDLEEALQDFRIREAEWAREKEGWVASHQQMQRYIEEMTLEKEELVRRHTIDTGDLRKKNAALLEHAHKFDAISMSAVPSSTGYSADFSDFEHLTMETSPWDHFAMANDFSVDAEPKHDTALVLPKKEKRPITEDEKSATSGLLLMLLLCGAWVTANHTATAPATIPRMPDEVRAASAVVLENIYHDAGLQPYPPAPSTSSVGRRESYHPSTTSMKTTLSAAEIASLSTSPLAALHHQLVTPSEEQQREQIFSLSTNQYHDLTSGECFDDPKPTTQPHRRNLGDALAAMRHDHRGSVAEAYTRSLMWDEVPTNVVRDFARMVAECNAGTVRPESGDCLS